MFESGIKMGKRDGNEEVYALGFPLVSSQTGENWVSGFCAYTLIRGKDTL